VRVAKRPAETHFAVLDFDFKAKDDISIEEFRKRIRPVLHELEASRLHPQVFESTGGKGFHCWVRWDGLQPNRNARGLLLTILKKHGFTEGKGHVANGEVEIFPAEWRRASGATAACIALPLFGGNRQLTTDLEPCDIADKWVRGAKPPDYSVPLDDDEDLSDIVPDQIYNEEQVVDALKHISADCDVYQWHRIGYALKRAFGEDGFDIWDQWSQSAADRYPGDIEIEKVWNGLKPRRNGRAVTVGTIIHLARENGWIPDGGLTWNLTDLGMARLVAARYGENLRWCSTNGDWYVYERGQWITDEGNVRVRRCLQFTARGIAERAYKLMEKGNELGEALDAFQQRYQNAQPASGALKQLETMDSITMSLDDFDTEPGRTLAANGVVIVTDGDGVRVEDVSPDDHFMQRLGVDYDPDATCPQFDAWMKQVFPKEEERPYFQLLIGAALGGYGNKIKRVPYLYGEQGDNGKTTLGLVLLDVFGDYGMIGDPVSFTEDGKNRSAGGPRADLVATQKKKLIFYPELSGAMTFDEVELRNRSGGDSQKARDLFERGKAAKQWEPWDLNLFSGNGRPRLAEGSKATFNRLVSFNIEFSLPVDQQDDDFRKKIIKKEGSGILNWAIDGWKLYLERGKATPASLVENVAAYAREEDPVAAYMEARLSEQEGSGVLLATVWTDFEEWYEKRFRRQPPFKNVTLKRKLEEYGIRTDKSKGRGVELLNVRLGKAENLTPSSNDESDKKWLEELVEKVAQNHNIPRRMSPKSFVVLSRELGLEAPTTDYPEMKKIIDRLFDQHAERDEHDFRTIRFSEHEVYIWEDTTNEPVRFVIDEP
jgi:P4 family phage/plasmid primase-like protien